MYIFTTQTKHLGDSVGIGPTIPRAEVAFRGWGLTSCLHCLALCTVALALALSCIVQGNLRSARLDSCCSSSNTCLRRWKGCPEGMPSAIGAKPHVQQVRHAILGSPRTRRNTSSP